MRLFLKVCITLYWYGESACKTCEITNGTLTIMSFVYSLNLQEGEEVCHFVTLFVLLALSRHSLVNCSGILVFRGGGRIKEVVFCVN